jgi:hypothetical protein
MAQKLFGDIPAAATRYPGMVTPDITADVQSNMSIQDQAAAYALQQRMKADRKAEWAQAAAANRARMDLRPGYQKGWNVVNPQEEKLKQAFSEVYTPQLRRTFHDQALATLGAAGDVARRRASYIPGHIGQYTGGTKSSSAAFNQGRVPWQGQDEGRLRRTLAQMWRAQTDPYLRAVGGGMNAATAVKAMQPGQIPKGVFGAYTFGEGGQRIPLRNG